MSNGQGAPSGKNATTPKENQLEASRENEAELQAALSWAMPRAVEHDNQVRKTNQLKERSWAALTPPNQAQSAIRPNANGYDMLAVIGAERFLILEHKVLNKKSDGTYEFDSSEEQMSLMARHAENNLPCHFTFQDPDKPVPQFSYLPTDTKAREKLEDIRAILATNLRPKMQFVLTQAEYDAINPTNVFELMFGKNRSAASDAMSVDIVSTLIEIIKTKNGRLDNLTLLLLGRANITMMSGARIAQLVNKFYNQRQYFTLKNSWGMLGKFAQKTISIAILENPDQLRPEQIDDVVLQMGEVLENSKLNRHQRSDQLMQICLGGVTPILAKAAKAAYPYLDSLYVRATKPKAENASDNGEEPPEDINANASEVIKETEAILKKTRLRR